jgi:hypothetical protein
MDVRTNHSFFFIYYLVQNTSLVVLFILNLYKPSNRYDHYLAPHTHHVIYCHLNNFPLNHTTFPLILSLYISCTTLVLQVTTYYSLFFYYSVFWETYLEAKHKQTWHPLYSVALLFSWFLSLLFNLQDNSMLVIIWVGVNLIKTTLLFTLNGLKKTDSKSETLSVHIPHFFVH